MGWVHSVLSVMHLFFCIGAVARLAAWCLGTRAVEQSGHWFDIMSCQTRLDSSFVLHCAASALKLSNLHPHSCPVRGSASGMWS